MSDSIDVRIKAMDIAAGFSSGLSYMDYKNIFNILTHTGLDTYFYKEDLLLLYELATNPKYNIVSKKDKLSVYDQIICPRGFYRSHSGTNRIVYSHNTDDSFIIKVALDKIGVGDNNKEFYNQKVLQPFVPKIFDISDNEAVILMEKVKPILNKEEFSLYGNSIFDLITYLVGCGYIMEDIGTDFFMNWGVRQGFGPVLLDYPYVYRVNKSRLNCIQRNIDGSQCKGKIIYDDGYNYLICDTCGKRYAAKDIGSNFKYLNEIRSKMKRSATMEKISFKIQRGNQSYEITSGSSIIDEESSRNILPKIENPGRFIVKRGNTFTPSGETTLDKYINKHNAQAIKNNSVKETKQFAQNNTNQIFVNNNNLMISTILKEFGYNTEDISDTLMGVIANAMEENVDNYLTVANKIVFMDTFKDMTDKQKAEYEEKIKNMLHTKRLRVEENDIITHYYAANTYYNREKLRDVIREALAEYRVDVHVDAPSTVEENIKEEVEEEKINVVEEKKEEKVKLPTPEEMKMQFSYGNALGDPVMTPESAAPVEMATPQKTVTKPTVESEY